MQSLQQDFRALGEVSGLVRLILIYFLDNNYSKIKDKITAIKTIKSVLKGEEEFEKQDQKIKSIVGRLVQFIDLLSQQYKLDKMEIVDTLPFTPEEVEIYD